MLSALGGEAGCKRLARDFYARVAVDPVLRPLFPGKSLRCATEAFAAFLIQFLGGDEEQTQFRWHLSLRESHARLRIGRNERRAWLRQMRAALEAASLEEAARKALVEFFEHSSAYLTGEDAPRPAHAELATRWDEQRALDDAVAAIALGRDREATTLAARLAARPGVFTGLLARMMQSGRPGLVAFAADAVGRDRRLAGSRSAGRTLLHFAAGAGCLEVVGLLLRLGTYPDIRDSGGHTPLYRAADECASEAGPEVVRILVRAGADVNAANGVTRATALHMAARRGHLEIARVLLDAGASPRARDRKGDTPLERANHCRRHEVARLLAARTAWP